MNEKNITNRWKSQVSTYNIFLNYNKKVWSFHEKYFFLFVTTRKWKFPSLQINILNNHFWYFNCSCYLSLMNLKLQNIRCFCVLPNFTKIWNSNAYQKHFENNVFVSLFDHILRNFELISKIDVQEKNVMNIFWKTSF